MAVFVVVMLMVLVVLVVVGKVEEAKEKVRKSKMTEHSSLEYAKIFVQRQRLILLLIICVQLYLPYIPLSLGNIFTLIYPTFINVPYFYKCIFVPKCAHFYKCIFDNVPHFTNVPPTFTYFYLNFSVCECVCCAWMCLLCLNVSAVCKCVCCVWTCLLCLNVSAVSACRHMCLLCLNVSECVWLPCLLCPSNSQVTSPELVRSSKVPASTKPPTFLPLRRI